MKVISMLRCKKRSLEGAKLMAIFSIDLPGRVKNFELPRTKPLMPLFETIVNSIYAIEERQQNEDKIKGYINIEIIREPQMRVQTEGIDSSINDITGFVVTDNGVGFDENNMKSFLQSDSTYRAEKGGKGVGRFAWLKAFKEADIESSFIDAGEWVRRKFCFTLEQNEINDSLEDIEPLTDNKTIVALKECLAPYKKNLPKKGEVIATKIMQHCFIYLMSAKCPVIKVADEDQTYNINEMFDERIKKESEKIEFEIGNEKFSLLHTQIEDAAFGASKLYLYANDRMVQEINLEKEIVDLDKNLFSAKGYYYAGILSGKFLDENVGTNRTSFDISDTAEDESEISMDDIISNVAQNVQIYLSDYLSEVKGKKEERVRTYIKDEAPQYGHLLKYMREDVEAIKPYLPDSKLDDELYKIKRKFDNQLKKDNLDIIKTLEVGATSLDSYQEKFQKQFAKISEANKASLAEYVAHRKVILELLKKGIQSDDFGKYSKEAYIHNLIYPMRRTSDEIEYQAHNLWLIDERLAYCEYVSSDIPFDNNPREDRTDVMILDKPVAVSDEPNTGREYETIVILELKKPMRNDYTQAENPIIQMLGYVDKISSNEMKDKNGRLIKTGTNTQFYLYAVCDITSKLRKIAEDFDFIETPDKRGMYKYHDKKRAYIEILSFDKIIDDAGKRNSAQDRTEEKETGTHRRLLRADRQTQAGKRKNQVRTRQPHRLRRPASTGPAAPAPAGRGVPWRPPVRCGGAGQWPAPAAPAPGG